MSRQAEKDAELSSLLSSASLVFIGAAFASVATLLERIIIGRALSIEAYGEVSIGLAVMTLTVTLSLFGLSQGVPRYISRFEDEASVRGAWATGLTVSLGIAVVAAAVLYVGADFLASALLDGANSPRLLRLFVLAIPFVVGFKIGVGGIRGHENTIYKTYVSDLLYPISRLALLGILLALNVGIFAAGYAYIAAGALAFVAAHYFLNRLVPLVGAMETNEREMLAFSAPLVISSVLSMLLTRTDTMMLGYFESSREVGIYASAFPLANGMLIILSSFGFLYLPLASRLDSDGERDEIDAIYKLTTKWIFIVTFPAFLAFVVFPADVLTIFFGEKFAAGALALSILSVGFFTNAAGGRNRETLSALGYTKFIMISNSLIFVLNVALNLVLIPRFSYEGAAVASAVSYVTLNVLIYLVLRLKFEISPFSTWSLRTFLVLPALMIPPTWLLSHWVSLSVVTLPVFLVAAGLVSIAVVMLTGCLQPRDVIALEFFEKLAGRRLDVVRRHIPDAETAE